MPAEAARSGSVLGGQSIAVHIARLYTLSAVVLLSIVIGLLYWVESQSLEWGDVHDLSDKVQQLRTVLSKHPDDWSFLVHEVKDQGGIYAPGQHYIYYSRVLDEHGQVLIETPGADQSLPPALFPPAVDIEAIPEQAQRRQGNDGRSYLVMSAWGETGGARPARRTIQVALDDTDEVEVVTRYQRVSLLLVAIGIFASALVGGLIARSGMKPVRHIARVAEQITASRLHQRLQPERWPLELASLAKAFDGMLGRLDNSYSRMAQFSGDLAHELRTPIQIMMGQTEVALSTERAPAEYRRVLASNLEEFHRITRTINQLLFLARAENPKTEFDRSWLDGREELEAIREFHEALAEEHGITVNCVGQATLYANALLLRRAVTNLLSNSLRHTPPGGQVTLSVEQTKDRGAVLQVSDTGCGIRREDLPKVCERLFCSPGAARCAEGTGLGLAIVKSIAELHGGSATVDSRPGQGTTVTLSLPPPERDAVAPKPVIPLAA